MVTKSLRWAFALPALGWATLAHAQAFIEGIEAQKSGDGAEIRIKGHDLGRPRIIRSKGNKQYVFEFHATMQCPRETLQLGYGNIDTVKLAWNAPKPPKIWVVVNLLAEGLPTINPSESGWTISVQGTKIDSTSVMPVTAQPSSGFVIRAKHETKPMQDNAPVSTLSVMQIRPAKSKAPAADVLMAKAQPTLAKTEPTPAPAQTEAIKVPITGSDSGKLLTGGEILPGLSNRARATDFILSSTPTTQIELNRQAVASFEPELVAHQTILKPTTLARLVPPAKSLASSKSLRL